jgi:hypothetical protein
VAWIVARAVAGKVTPAELALDVLDGDRQPTGEQVVAVTANRLLAAE